MKILVIQETNWEERGPYRQHHLVERLAEIGNEIFVIDYDFLWTRKNRYGFQKTTRKKNKGKIIPDIKIDVIIETNKELEI